MENELHISALEDITFIRRRYSIPESALVAPRPDPALFGETDDPEVVQAVVDSAAELLDGIYAGAVQSPSLVAGVLALEAARRGGRLDALRPAESPWPARRARQLHLDEIAKLA